MIDINGKRYYFNLKKICDFIDYSDKHNLIEKEIIDTYSLNTERSEFEIQQKQAREVTTQGNTQMDNIKYDLLKIFIGQIIGYGYNEEDAIDYENTKLPFGLEICMLTLIKEGFLIEEE